VPSDQPRYPVHALSRDELRRYRRALEHSLTGIPAGAPVHELLHTRLAEVLVEEECRAAADYGDGSFRPGSRR
jgi:hypothetical protein